MKMDITKHWIKRIKSPFYDIVDMVYQQSFSHIIPFILMNFDQRAI